MNKKNDTNIDFIDLIIIFSKNKLIIFYFLIISVLGCLIYFNFFYSNNYVSKITIDTNNELFLSNDSFFNYNDRSIFIDIYKTEFYSQNNFISWQQNFKNTSFTKNEFLGINFTDENFFRTDKSSRVFKFINDDSIDILLINTNDTNKINNIYDYANYINNIITNDFIALLSADLSEYNTFNFKDNFEVGIITKKNKLKFIIDNIKLKNIYNISNPTIPVNKSIEFEKILLLFLFAGLFLSFLFIIFKYFYYLKIDKKNN